MANGVADGTGPLLLHVGGTTSTTGTVAAGSTVAGVKAAAGLGVADGTGPALLHVLPTSTTVAGAAAGAGAKTAVATKLAALGAAVGGMLGIVLAGAAVAGVGYLGYRLVKDLGGKRRRASETA
jgi:hypothetical protein